MWAKHIKVCKKCCSFLWCLWFSDGGAVPRWADLSAFHIFLPELSPLPAGASALTQTHTEIWSDQHPMATCQPHMYIKYQEALNRHTSRVTGVVLTEYIAFSASNALACFMASTSSLSCLNILPQRCVSYSPSHIGSVAFSPHYISIINYRACKYKAFHYPGALHISVLSIFQYILFYS